MSIESRGGTDVVGRLTEQRFKLSEEKKNGQQPKVIFRKSFLMETPLESPQNSIPTTENGNGSNGKVNGKELLDATKFAPFEPQKSNGQVKESKWNGHAKEVKVNGYINGKDKSLNGRPQMHTETTPSERVDILKGFGAAKTVKDLIQDGEDVDMFAKTIAGRHGKDNETNMETIRFAGGAKMSVISRERGEAMLSVPDGKGVKMFHLKDAAVEDAETEESGPSFNFVLPQAEDGTVRLVNVTKDKTTIRKITEVSNQADRASVVIAKQLALHAEQNAVVERRKQMGELPVDLAGSTLPVKESTGIPRLETHA